MFNELIEKYNLKLCDLEPAFLHISYANLNGLESNERLEFLGDSIINFFTTLELMNKYKHVDEGELTKFRARMVSSDSLSAIFKYFKLKQYLKIIGGVSKKIEANTVEAVVANVFNIFINRGDEKQISAFVNDFVLKHCLTNLVDYKSNLQEVLQKTHIGEINYNTVKKSNQFVSIVSCAGKIYGEGKGTSKKNAEQKAAKNALDRIMKKQ